MKITRRTSGPFAERPYYTQGEIEQTCTDELRAVDLLPASPEPIRIDRFIEKRFGICVTYEDLPDGVLGFTECNDKGVKAIVIDSKLDDEGSYAAERRIRTTMAHESGHGLLHAYLIALGLPSRSLFGDGMDPIRPRLLCRTHDSSKASSEPRSGYDGRWWEYQANQAMGALLLPRGLVHRALEDFLVPSALGVGVLDERRREQAVRFLADAFDVNAIAARLRLTALHPAHSAGQLTL